MTTPLRMAAALTAAPLLILSGAGVAAAANQPNDLVIPALDAEYIGPLSSAGRMPKVEVEAEQVARAFTKLVSYRTVSKVVRATDGEATKKGTVVKAEGYRCKATKYRLVNPGTAGEFANVNWKCTFVGADTPTEITLTYKQASL